MQRWALQAVRDDVSARAPRARAARAARGRRARRPSEAVDAFLEAQRATRCAASPASRARWRGRGGADLAGLTLAVRQLRALAS